MLTLTIMYLIEWLV